MQYFRLEPLADYGRGEYCFVDDTPDGIATRWHRLASGLPFDNEYPTDPAEVTLKLGADYPGLRLPSFIGNTPGMLVVSSAAADVMQAANVGRMERLPFTLLDHKQRVHSRDYVFINPLERRDALNLEHSEVRRGRKGDIRDVTTMVLDRTKEHEFIDLFRLGEDPSFYLVSETMVTALRQSGATNFNFIPVEAR